MPDATIDIVLSAYTAESRFLKQVSLCEESECDGISRYSMAGRFSVEKCIYASGGGLHHVTAAEIVLCTNQLATVLFAELSARDVLLDRHGRSLNDLSQIRVEDMMIVRIESLDFRSRLIPHEFEGRVQVKKCSIRPRIAYAQVVGSFQDEQGGRCEGTFHVVLLRNVD